MDRRAFARHRTGAALLLGLSLRAPSASAERAEPDETRVGTVDGKAAEELTQQTNVQPVPGDEARVSFALSPRVELPRVAEVAPELTVRGEPSTPSISSHTREEVHRTPGAFGAPFRAEEARGATPVDSGPPFHVRGAPPGNDDFLDRVRVPHLYHIELDPSVIHPGSFDRVNLHLGGYPAPFNRFADGVASAQTRGLEPTPAGEASLRLFNLGGLLEPTFARGRGSLLPALLSLLIPEVKLDNCDHQARATREPSARDRFSVFGFGSYDLLGEKRNGILTRLGDAFRPKITLTW